MWKLLVRRVVLLAKKYKLANMDFHSPAPQTTPQRVQSSARDFKKNLLTEIIRTLIILLLIVIGISIWFHLNGHQDKGQVAKQSKPAMIPIYRAVKLPAGYSVDSNSYSKSDQVVAYTISGPEAKKIFFSFQPRPLQSVLDDFKSEKAAFTEDVACPVGEAFIGSVHGQTVGSIAAPKTWILITAPSDISSNVLKEIIGSLQESISPTG